jgi:hypothetical protein
MVADDDFSGGRQNLGLNVLITVIALQSIALYNVVELTFIIWKVFKRRSGTYFWSFVAATYGILPYSVGFIAQYAGPQTQAAKFAYITVHLIGWYFMVTGQSLVLWSRLHIIMRDEFKLRLILWMIIINGLIVYVPITVVLYGTAASESATGEWAKVYSVFGKIQVTLIFVQESVISLVYVYETLQLSKELAIMRDRARSRQLRNSLIWINIIIIVLDTGILALEYAEQFVLQTGYKGFVYSVKLKLQFTILNQLVDMVSGNRSLTLS